MLQGLGWPAEREVSALPAPDFTADRSGPVQSSNKWTPFPDALRRAEAKGIDRAEFITALIADLASPDTKAVVRGWARLTEDRLTTMAEDRVKDEASEQLGLLLRSNDEFSPDFPHELARRLHEAAKFRPAPKFHIPAELYNIPSEFWKWCGPVNSNCECHWTDDPEKPYQWVSVEWALGTASCMEILYGTPWGQEHDASAYWEFSALEINKTAIEAAIRKLDVAAQQRRIEQIKTYPVSNKYTAYTHFVTNAQSRDFEGWKRELFFNLWGKHRPPGKRGRKPNARAS